MPEEAPDTPPPLEYARSTGLPPRPKSLFEIAGFHFVAGAGTSTLLAALLILWHRRSDYPPTLACGGIFAGVIQWSLLAFAAACRRYFSGALLYERSTRTTVLAGLIGGALVFAIPMLFEGVATGLAAAICATLIPLCAYPLMISFVVFRQTRA
jgi:hypothetical protein